MQRVVTQSTSIIAFLLYNKYFLSLDDCSQHTKKKHKFAFIVEHNNFFYKKYIG